MSIIFYKVKCPRCKSTEKVMVDEIDWRRMNHHICSQCSLPIRITDDFGFLKEYVIPVVRCDDEL